MHKKQRRIGSAFAFLSFLIALGTSTPVQAHPHAWISVRTSVVLNDEGKAIALREHWLFDKAYSAYAAKDFNPHKNGKFTESDLLPLAQENVKNLREFNYFTVFETTEGKPVALQDAKDIASAYEAPLPPAKKKLGASAPVPEAPTPDKTSLSGKQIAMDFTVPLSVPVNLRGQTATYRIYDPTYYVDMTHDDRNPVSFVNAKDNAPVAGCRAKVEVPKVDQAMIFSAAALDKHATAPKDLGYYFSEKVTLSCSQSN